MAECLFCKFVAGQGPKFVHEDADCVGFDDINPQAPTHVLFVTRKHIATVNDITDEDRARVGSLFLAAAKVARERGHADSGYRVVMNTQADAGQSVFHIHLHLLGGRHFSWPPG